MKRKSSEDLSQIIEVYDFMVQSGLNEFEWHQDKVKIKIKRKSFSEECCEKTPVREDITPGESVKEKHSLTIKSPIAGIFYKSPSPSSARNTI